LTKSGGFCILDNMKHIILNRINDLKFMTENFNKPHRTWSNFKINNIHISKINFEELSNDLLLHTFERMINKLNLTRNF